MYNSSTKHTNAPKTIVLLSQVDKVDNVVNDKLTFTYI